METETLESLKSKIFDVSKEKNELQKNFDQIKKQWIEEKAGYKNAISNLEKESRLLVEKNRILEEQNICIEERCLLFQKVSETHESFKNSYKKIMKEYRVKKGMMEMKIDKIIDFLQEFKKTEIMEMKKNIINYKNIFGEDLKKNIDKMKEMEIESIDLKKKHDDLLKILELTTNNLISYQNQNIIVENEKKNFAEQIQRNLSSINSLENDNEIARKIIKSLEKELCDKTKLNNMNEQLEKLNEKLKYELDYKSDLINFQKAELEKFQLNESEKLKELELIKQNKEVLEKANLQNKQEIENLVINIENNKREFEKAKNDFHDQLESHISTIKYQENELENNKIEINNLNERIKILEKSPEFVNNLRSNLEVSHKKIAELELLVKDLKEENKLKLIELSDLKELFYTLQNNQQDELIELFSQSAENLSNFSKLKEKEKSQDLKKLKDLEKELENYKPNIRSPKLELILKQQKELIEQIKAKTQGDKLNIKEFEMGSLAEIRVKQKEIEQKQVINKDNIYFNKKYIDLLESKRREIECFLKTIEELQEDNIYLKEIIKTKDFEIFYFKAELFNQRMNFKCNLTNFQMDFPLLKNYLINIKLLTNKERYDFISDFQRFQSIISEKINEKKLTLEEKENIMKLILAFKKNIDQKSDCLIKKLDLRGAEMTALLNKIKIIQIFFNKNRFYDKNQKSDILKKLLRIYKLFLQKNEISTINDNITHKTYENPEQSSLFLEIFINENNAKTLKKEEIEGFVSLIRVSLVRILEIIKTFAVLLKNFLLIESKYPAQFNRIKEKFHKFLNFIEENNQKIITFYDENTEKKGVLEKFLDGFDLLNDIIKDTFNYRSKK